MNRFTRHLLRQYLVAGILGIEVLRGAPLPPSHRNQHSVAAEWRVDTRVDRQGWHAAELIHSDGRSLVVTLPCDAAEAMAVGMN